MPFVARILGIPSVLIFFAMPSCIAPEWSPHTESFSGRSLEDLALEVREGATASDRKMAMYGVLSWFEGFHETVAFRSGVLVWPDESFEKARAGGISQRDAWAATSIAAGLDDRDTSVRQAALHCLSWLGPPAMCVKERIEAAAKVDDPDVALDAADCLMVATGEYGIARDVCYRVISRSPLGGADSQVNRALTLVEYACRRGGGNAFDVSFLTLVANKSSFTKEVRVAAEDLVAKILDPGIWRRQRETALRLLREADRRDR